MEECLEKSTPLETPLRLQTFIAGRNRLEYLSTVALSKAFEKIGTLEEIAMPQNGITWKGVTALAKAVELNPLLRSLNLGDNTFGRKGAFAMAEVGAAYLIPCWSVVITSTSISGSVRSPLPRARRLQ